MRNSVENLHIPVLLERCIELLAPGIRGESPVVIDCTLGLGGHTASLLTRFSNLTVLGFDRDPSAIALAKQRLSEFGQRFVAVNENYDQISTTLQELGISKVQGVLMDLGVSSMQLDQKERGFSYSQDAPLDMRMDQTAGSTAADLLAKLTASELTRIFRLYGEERFAGQIARKIVSERETSPIISSARLNKLVESVVPRSPGKTNSHPAKRIYQALRIAVNDELGGLERALPQAIDALEIGARIVVMSYHSLEDGIVKEAFQSAATSKTPAELPFELPGTSPTLRVITKGVERASELELQTNPRSASARLRAAEKLEVR